MKIAFAGLRHDHIYDLYNMIKGNSNFEILGEFEENEEARAAAMEKGLCCVYESYEQLLADKNVEAVALGGCYGDRGGMAIKALRAGKHVIADKPLCTKTEELDEIEKAAKESGCKVSCMFTMRFSKNINAVKKLVESGELGEINNVFFGGQHPLNYGKRPAWYFEEGKHGGVINDIAIHGIDIINYALGLNVKDILAARCWNKFAAAEPHFKDSAQFMAIAQNGAGIQADVSYATPVGVGFALPYYWQFYVWGTKGMVSFAVNSDEICYYAGDNPNPVKLEVEDMELDYATDFLKMVNGEDTILPMEDVLKATRQTLEFQEFSDKN